MPVNKEKKLIDLCKKNDRTAQKQIYDGYAPLFFTICCRYAKDVHDAEQLMQDGFLKIFTSIDSFKGKGSFEGWMKRILINTCLDFLKSKQHVQAMKVNYPENIPDIKGYISSNEGLEYLESAYLLNLIQELSQTTRTVFNLFVFEGYSHKDIASVLDISEGTSQWHLNNARKILKEKIIELNKKEINSHEETRNR